MVALIMLFFFLGIGHTVVYACKKIIIVVNEIERSPVHTTATMKSYCENNYRRFTNIDILVIVIFSQVDGHIVLFSVQCNGILQGRLMKYH